MMCNLMFQKVWFKVIDSHTFFLSDYLLKLNETSNHIPEQTVLWLFRDFWRDKEIKQKNLKLLHNVIKDLVEKLE